MDVYISFQRGGKGVKTTKSAKASEQVMSPVDPITSLMALIPSQTEQAGGDVPMPSGEGFARQFFRAWTRRLMLFCGLLAVALSLAVPLLSLLRVSEVTLEGQGHYGEDVLLATADIVVGDELLAFRPDDIEQDLLATHPYLATARVTRALSGRVHISVTERTPLWALYLSEESVALLDQSMQVLELTSSGGGLCLVKWELFCSEEQSGQEQNKPEIRPGTAYRGNPAAIAKLGDIHAALQSLGYDDSPALVDMSDRYAVTLCLSDGTTIALHECLMPAEQFRAALGALQAYRQQYGDQGPMSVDVDDFSRVSLRPIPKSGQ
jgi:cell division septal protein FtsQ